MQSYENISSVVLVNNQKREYLLIACSLLDANKINYVHISGGTKTPYPIGLRVREDEYEKAKYVLKSLDEETFKQKKEYIITDEEKFKSKVTIVLIVLLIIAYFLFPFIFDK